MARESIDALVARIQTLAENPKTRLADLLPHVEHEDSRVRAAALSALWNFPCDASLLTLLRSARTDVDPEVQAVAAAALGRYIWSGMQLDEALDDELGITENVTAAQVKQARDGLHALYQDTARARQVRMGALEALAFDPDPYVQREIDALWLEDARDSKVIALRSMGRSGRPQWRRLILEALGTSDPELRLAAIQAAGDSCIEDAEGPLLELAQSADRQVALAAIWSLRNVITTRDGRKALEKLARSKDPQIKARAREAIQDMDAMDVEERGDEGDDD